VAAKKNATRTVPMSMVACDAVTTGFVESLARPGGNLTGVTCITSELMPKRMAVFLELCRRRPASWSFTTQRTSVKSPPSGAPLFELAKELGLDAKAVQFRTPEDIERAFSAFATIAPMASSS